MKRLLVSFTALLLWTTGMMGQGIPFLRNFTPQEYHGNSMNFDVITDNEGTAYIANFEGVLYYDHAEWRIIHTPHISRVTVIYRDKNGAIWAGGYNYFGRIEKNKNGELVLKSVGKPGLFRGEVQEIWEQDGMVTFQVNNGNIYKTEGDSISLKKQTNKGSRLVGTSDIDTDAQKRGKDAGVLNHAVKVSLGNGLQAITKQRDGLTITDEAGRQLYTITEDNGLCSNNVAHISYDGHGTLWGVTDNGIFSIAMPSAFSRFTSYEGLLGAVQCMTDFNGRLYVGTQEGLYRLEGKIFKQVGDIKYACRQLDKLSGSLLAATSNGIYRITADGHITQLSTTDATALFVDGNHYYVGETNGVYQVQSNDNSYKLVAEQDRCTKLAKDAAGTIWLQSLYGEVWSKPRAANKFEPYHLDAKDEAATIVPTQEKMEIISAVADTPFPYPLFSCLDQQGVTWLTDSEGKGLYRWKDGKRLDDIAQLLTPVSDIIVRALLLKDDHLWIGGDNGLTVIDLKQKDPILTMKPQLMFRSIVLNSDSILWGGYGPTPSELPNLASNERNLRFTYAVDYTPLIGKTLYRYRMDNGKWSAWADDNDAEFLNLASGKHQLEIQALLASGLQTDITSIKFYITYPFYMKWYMGILYFLILLFLTYLFLQYRIRRLEREKHQLESIVQERTAEVVRQKDEIEEKSNSLEKTLNELHETQGELIRQEKMATVGKLTQGLIDRILNPLNYINNFSKLSEGLVKDIEANIEDEKDNMDEENYEDTMDVIGMLQGNLQKVGEHGVNTTRTLKAMEEMLKDRSGGIVPMELTTLLRQDEQMLNTYYTKEITGNHITVNVDLPDHEVHINGNADQLSKTIMSMLGNSVYAVVKKAQREQFDPMISLRMTANDNQVTITIRDNGIGIEDTIIDKIFDPFFTTKTTGEAAGIGLYLSREIIQNHGGDITAQSVKNQYSEFTITLPAIKS